MKYHDTTSEPQGNGNRVSESQGSRRRNTTMWRSIKCFIGADKSAGIRQTRGKSGSWTLRVSNIMWGKLLSCTM